MRKVEIKYQYVDEDFEEGLFRLIEDYMCNNPIVPGEDHECEREYYIYATKEKDA